jgi:hypothetical protein
VPRDLHIYYNAIGVLGVLGVLFDQVLWVVGACVLMFFCLGVFGVWLVRVLLVCVWLGYVLGGLQKLQSYVCGVFCVEKLRNLDLCLFGILTFVTFWVCACSCCLSV